MQLMVTNRSRAYPNGYRKKRMERRIVQETVLFVAKRIDESMFGFEGTKEVEMQ